MSFFTADYLEFFKELAANNHKEWFDANRKRYETNVKETFKALFVEIHGEKNKKLDKDLLEAAAQEPLIYNKQFYFYSTFEAETLLDPKLDQLMIECYQTGRPLELFFNQFIQRSWNTFFTYSLSD